MNIALEIPRRAAWDARWAAARLASAPIGDRLAARVSADEAKRRADALIEGGPVPEDVAGWVRAVAAEYRAGRRVFSRTARAVA